MRAPPGSPSGLGARQSHARSTAAQPLVHGANRELVIFLAVCAILVTLVGQGLTMPVLIRALGIEDDGLDADEE